MVSKANIKFVKSLSSRKNRHDAGLFVAEGTKTVADLLSAPLEVKEIFAVKDWLAAAPPIPPAVRVEELSASDLRRMSELTTANQVIALVAIPNVRYEAAALDKQLVVGLEELQDPGNLGAIIRLCDWFGVANILASRGTVDCFNAKVVQATTGSIGRVRVHYRDGFAESLAELQKRGKAIYTATLAGDDVYRAKLSTDAVVVFGNEGGGLSRPVVDACNQKLRIPRFPDNLSSAQSLNVAVAAGIVCAEFRRRG
jgi:TrmH family RNA methyltransferase